MRSSQDVTCVKVRVVRVWSIKGKQMVWTTLTPCFPKPLLRSLRCDWRKRTKQTPPPQPIGRRRITLPTSPSFGPRVSSAKAPPLSASAHSAVLFWDAEVAGVLCDFFFLISRFLGAYLSLQVSGNRRAEQPLVEIM